ncbi:MAG: hypothetical protein LC796_03010 [Acidobacteria bacterium]|nr:hypothetical protein [Acidobacteriota bacterium]MCA1611661.1 hypothetical protein [Acidobacteriota bacterium]
MIVYEEAPGPVVRAGELDLNGRRIAARAFACAGEAGPPAFRFDPVERRIVPRRASGALAVGPVSPRSWSAAFAKTAAGPVIVEGACREEEVRGVYLAASEGALDSGRGVYLLDPPPAGLPGAGAERRDGPPARVAVFTWAPGETGPDPAALEAVRLRGIPAGVAWPVIPGWTDGPAFFRPYLEAARAAGAGFALPLAPAGTPEFRRFAVEARGAVDPAAAEAFFDRMHHSPWEEEIPGAVQAARAAADFLGLSPLPPRPAAPSEPPGNWRAASRLEEAAAGSHDEHRAARLQAAVRWIDSCARDLGAIHREGNFSRAFPFGPELAREAESALAEAAP